MFIAVSRLPCLRPDQLDESARMLWDFVIATRGSQAQTKEAGLGGPFNALLYTPDVGARVAELGQALRFGASIDRRLAELAIITVGAHWRTEYQWWAHVRMARQHGLSQSTIDSVAQGENLPVGRDDEVLVHSLVRGLLATGRIGEATYNKACRLLGNQGLVELLTLCGYYSLVSFVLNGFEVPLPPGVAPQWPE